MAEATFSQIRRDIPFTGFENISLYSSTNLYRDESGMIRPFPDFEDFTDIPNNEKIQFFIFTDDTDEIIVYWDGISFYYKIQGTAETKNLLNYDGSPLNINTDDLSFERMGSLLILIDKTNIDIYTFLWNRTDKSFSPAQPKLLPAEIEAEGINVPLASLSNILNSQPPAGGLLRKYESSLSITLLGESMRGYYYVARPTTMGNFTSDEIDSFRNEYLLYLSETLNKDMKRGLFQGIVSIRVAYKMFNGKYIYYSLPAVVTTGLINDQQFNTKWAIQSQTSTQYTNYYILFFCNQAYTSFINLTINIPDLNKINKDIIKGIAIFITKPKMLYQPSFDIALNPASGTQYVEMKNIDNHEYFLNNEFLNEPYYKVKEISYDSLQPTQTIQLKDIDLTTLETNETLPMETSFQHSITGKQTFVFNNKLYLGNTSYKLFNNISSLLNNATGNNIKLACRLNTEQGNKFIISKQFSTDGYAKLVLSYPDIKAAELNILNETNNILLSFTLDKCFYDNTAFKSFISDFINLYIDSYQLHPDTTKKYPKQLTLPSPSPTKITEDNILTNNNGLAISDIYNPISFQYKNFLQIGNDTIIFINSQAKETSLGQFGQFPIIIANKNQIFLLDLSTENEITHIRQIFTDHIYTIQKAGDIIYFISNNGLNSLNGSTINPIFNLFNPAKPSYNSPLEKNKSYQNIIKNFNTHTNFSITNIQNITFIKPLNCLILSTNNESLILSNNFSSFIEKNIQTIFFNGKYHIAKSNNSFFNLNKIKLSYKDISIITNPISNQSPTSILNSKLIAYLNANLITLTIFASIDNKNFIPIFSNQLTKPTLNPIIPSTNASYYFYAITLTSKYTSPDSFISSLIINPFSNYQNPV